jgi:hypothetical protein
MKPNEIIGTLAWVGILGSFAYHIIYGISIWLLFEIFFFGMIVNIFLSWWGLTKFNDWWNSL